uniref:Uncharacterized protein n=1 Tax=Cacopsylla melanoneura TaxID=428564 RepID=A0A8D8TAF2_9HEMI
MKTRIALKAFNAVVTHGAFCILLPLTKFLLVHPPLKMVFTSSGQETALLLIAHPPVAVGHQEVDYFSRQSIGPLSRLLRQAWGYRGRILDPPTHGETRVGKGLLSGGIKLEIFSFEACFLIAFFSSFFSK